MSKQETLDEIRDFSEIFPKEAIKEIQTNRADYITDLLHSLEYVYHNAEKLRNDDSDYFLHTYAMYLLAEFREKRAFPLLINLLRLPEDNIDFILGDCLTDSFSRLLLSTFDDENTQMLLDIIENQELYKWARLAALSTYELLINEGFISNEESISYLRSLIHDKLPSDDSYVVFTGIVGCVIDAGLIDMIPDVRFLYDNDRVDEMMYGKYDSFIDWVFHKRQSKQAYIDNTISELERWACFKHQRDDDSTSIKKSQNDIFAELEKTIKPIKQEITNEQQPKKIGRNDACPCGSGKKYKKCCINVPQNIPALPSVEDTYDLLGKYPKDSTLFEQMFEKEAIDIDMLAYKALRHRTIPIWIERDLEQERIGKINYLDEALALFLDKCQREEIASFSAYDEKYMVHYSSHVWVSSIVDLIEDSDSEKIQHIGQKAEDVLQKFS